MPSIHKSFIRSSESHNDEGRLVLPGGLLDDVVCPTISRIHPFCFEGYRSAGRNSGRQATRNACFHALSYATALTPYTPPSPFPRATRFRFSFLMFAYSFLLFDLFHQLLSFFILSLQSILRYRGLESNQRWRIQRPLFCH